MADILKSRVAETTTTTGTGAITLAGAITSYRRFSAVCNTGDTTDYVIYAVDENNVQTGEWEEGVGTYSSANTLTRTTPKAGSSSTPVNFSAGTKIVVMTPTADRLASIPNGITTAGRALLDDADAAAQRTTLGLGDSATKSVGTTAGTVAAGDDSRLSDARTPTAHKSSHATGQSDALAPSDIGAAASGAIGSSGLTMATAKLLGRGTASTGAVEEITLGTNLSLSGTTLNATGGGGGEGARWIGAGELIPRVTTGSGIDGEELATNKINLDYLAFDAGTAEYAQASFSWPSGMATMTAKAYWTAASGSGAVVWGVQARCYADDDALDQAQGTAQTVTDTLLSASDTHITAATSAITPGGTVATGNLCVVQVYRDAANGSDTLAVDARLIGIRLEFAA